MIGFIREEELEAKQQLLLHIASSACIEATVDDRENSNVTVYFPASDGMIAEMAVCHKAIAVEGVAIDLQEFSEKTRRLFEVLLNEHGHAQSGNAVAFNIPEVTPDQYSLFGIPAARQPAIAGRCISFVSKDGSFINISESFVAN